VKLKERKRGSITTAEKVIKRKVGLLELGKQLGKVFKACLRNSVTIEN
jgi:hypothetical protein